MTRVLLLLALLGAWLGLPATSVLAFSDPGSFAQLPYAAGGGGRYFTGSPADGFTCKVCHAGGAEPKLEVSGLPPGGYYIPGGRYEIIVAWPAVVEKFGAALELTDLQGRTAGSLRLPPTSEIQAPEFCEPASDAILAASIEGEAIGRQVINVPDCGSRRLRFLWTAPAVDVGTVWFSGSSVWSDGQGDEYHDGVTDFGQVIASSAGAAVASHTTAGCSLVMRPDARRGTWSASAALWLLGALYLLRRRHRS
jgi:hypothetical protein